MTENLNFKTALNKAMALCAGREMCKSDISQKLLSWGVENNDIEKILSQLLLKNSLMKNGMSTAFVKDKFRYNRWGKVKIASALRMKNIPDETDQNIS